MKLKKTQPHRSGNGRLFSSDKSQTTALHSFLFCSVGGSWPSYGKPLLGWEPVMSTLYLVSHQKNVQRQTFYLWLADSYQIATASRYC